MSALYRVYDYHNKLFIENPYSFLNYTKKVKQHLMIGDFNIDINKNSNYPFAN